MVSVAAKRTELSKGRVSVRRYIYHVLANVYFIEYEKITAFELYKKAKKDKLSSDEFKKLLIDNGVIVKKHEFNPNDYCVNCKNNLVSVICEEWIFKCLLTVSITEVGDFETLTYPPTKTLNSERNNRIGTRPQFWLYCVIGRFILQL